VVVGNGALCLWKMVEDDQRTPRLLWHAQLNKDCTSECKRLGDSCQAVNYTVTVVRHLSQGRTLLKVIQVTIALFVLQCQRRLEDARMVPIE
jgi:hypothetical protein